MQLIGVFTTVATIEEARAMARSLVERKLVACAQITPIESFYQWQGEVQNKAECRLLLKTTEARRAAVEAAIIAMHSYDVPAIYSLPLQNVHPPFADWVEAGCSDAAVK